MTEFRNKIYGKWWGITPPFSYSKKRLGTIHHHGCSGGSSPIFTHPFRDSGHYRTEFRLNAYKEASGYAYEFDKALLDIIISDDRSEKNIVRIYVDNTTLEDCCDLVRIISLQTAV